MGRVWRYGAALALVGIGACARYDVAEGLAEGSKVTLHSAAPAFITLNDRSAHTSPVSAEHLSSTQEITDDAMETALKLGAIGVAGLGGAVLIGGKRIIFTPTHHPGAPRK